MKFRIGQLIKFPNGYKRGNEPWGNTIISPNEVVKIISVGIESLKIQCKTAPYGYVIHCRRLQTVKMILISKGHPLTKVFQ